MIICKLKGLVFVVLAMCAIGVIGRAEPAGQALTEAPMRFAIIGDRTGGHVEGIYEGIAAEVEAMRPDFIMTVGDHIEGYTEDTTVLNSQWDEYFAIVKPLSMPINYVPGNHDITTDAALPIYLKRVGKPYYSFDIRRCHFIVLDVSRCERSEDMDGEQLAWLIDDLDNSRNAVQTLVFFHKPFWYTSVSIGKPDTLHSLFKSYGVDAVFNGHFHNYFSETIDGIPYTAVGSSGGGLDAVPTDLDYHFTWVTVDGNGIHVTPIKRSGVKNWDFVTAGDLHLIDDINFKGLRFTVPARIGDDLKVSGEIAKLELTNLSNIPLIDTLRWQTPEGWTIEPAIAVINIGPGETRSFDFKVGCSKEPYPLPTVTLRYPFGEGKSIPVTATLKAERTIKAGLVSKPPVIDGALDETCWGAPCSRLFGRNADKPEVESTWVYFAYDKDNLYIAARCRESHMDSIRAAITARDGAIYGEDCLGLFFQPNMANDTAYQIYISPLGTVFDQKLVRENGIYYSGKRKWNGTYVVKASRDEGYWYAEAQIPLSQFGAAAERGEMIRANFVRKQKRLDNAADWQQPVDYNPESYGILMFE